MPAPAFVVESRSPHSFQAEEIWDCSQLNEPGTERCEEGPNRPTRILLCLTLVDPSVLDAVHRLCSWSVRSRQVPCIIDLPSPSLGGFFIGGLQSADKHRRITGGKQCEQMSSTSTSFDRSEIDRVLNVTQPSYPYLLFRSQKGRCCPNGQHSFRHCLVIALR